MEVEIPRNNYRSSVSKARKQKDAMLRVLTQVIPGFRGARSLKWSEKVCLYSYPGNLSRSFSATTQQNCIFNEENTLSKQVREYMRSIPEYATCILALPDSMSPAAASSVKIDEVQQLFLAISDSKESKPHDILKLLIECVSHKKYMSQDIKKLIRTLKFKEKVFETIQEWMVDDIKELAILMKYLNSKNSKYLTDVVVYIGDECVRRAPKADLEQCLKLFDIVLLLHGNSLNRRREFDIFMTLFAVHAANATPHHLVQIIYFVSIANKNKLNQEYIQALLSKLEEMFGKLNFIDCGIALEGIFKCNVKLKNSSMLLKQTAKCLETKLEKSQMLSSLELYAFIAGIKVIRAAKYHDKTLLMSVSNFVMKASVDTFQPVVIAHVLALYANSQMYDLDVFSKFEHAIFKHVSSKYHIVRSKDISRILWSFSHVGHKCNATFLEEVEKVLVSLLHKGEFNKYPQHLSGCLFSLAVYGLYPRELIIEAFKPQNIEKHLGHQRSKQFSRLLGLSEAIRIEAPALYVPLPQTYASVAPKRTLSDEIRYRPSVADLMKGVRFINKRVGACVFELKFLVPFINFASLIYYPEVLKMENISKNYISEDLARINELKSAKKIAFEIIDCHTSLFGSRYLIGILKLKVRLMDKCGWTVVTITEDEIREMNCDDKTMAAFILDTLSRLKM